MQRALPFEPMDASYEFMLIIKGSGSNVDEAFADALERLADDPNSAIHTDVTYEKQEEPDVPDEVVGCKMPLN